MSTFRFVRQKPFQDACNKSKEHMRSKFAHNVDKKAFWNHPYVRFLNDKLSMISKVFSDQCNVIVAHRTRRTTQILKFYNTLYGGRSGSVLLKRIREAFGLNINGNGRLAVLLSAVLFNWNENRITNQDMQRVTDDLNTFFEVKSNPSRNQEKKIIDNQGEEWEKVVENEHFTLWRCPVEGSSLYKYKVFGSYDDLSADVFYKLQLDLEYRRKWDNHVIKLEKVDVDKDSGSEVVYWATHFPLGGVLSCRDYVYVRRYKCDLKKNFAVISAHAVDHPQFPETSDYIRVDQYTSQMLIRPHKSFNEEGFDYVMSYYDDPKLYVPAFMVNTMMLKSLPNFIVQLHEAAKDMKRSGTYSGLPSLDSSTTMHSRLASVGQYQYLEREH